MELDMDTDTLCMYMCIDKCMNVRVDMCADMCLGMHIRARDFAKFVFFNVRALERRFCALLAVYYFY